jgi:hypothetical protein
MDPVPHAMYKSQEAVVEGMRLYDVAGLDSLTSAHQEHLPTADEQKQSTVYSTLELQTKKQPHRYVVYHRYLWLCLDSIREQISANDPEAKLPTLFTIIPQMKPKVRCIDIGTNQMVDLLVKLSEQADVNLPWPQTVKRTTATQWEKRVKAGEVWPTLFHGIPKHFTGTLTTDGVRAHWHVGQSKAEKKQMVTRNLAVRAKAANKRKRETKVTHGNKRRKKTKNKTEKVDVPTAVSASTLVPKHYGIHGHDVLVAAGPSGNVNFVYVDPGHATLIHAVRQHATPVAQQTLPIGPYTKRRRAILKHNALAQKDQSEFVLTNRHWRHDTKEDWARIKRLTLDAKLGVVQPAVDRLAATFPSSSFVYLEYLSYTVVKLETMEAFDVMSRLRAPRRWKLETYQAEQRAAETLCVDVQADMSSDVPTIIVWGAGSFGPTSRGHASAPNKRLQTLLARRFPVILCSEYGTSKHSCCCHEHVVGLRTPDYKRRSTVLQCIKCKTLLSRDASAAALIGDIFQFQRTGATRALPTWTEISSTFV